MNKNSGIKIGIVILVIICLFQGCGIASLSDTLETLNVQMEQMNFRIDNLERQMKELEELIDKNGIGMDVSYNIKEIDWENGKIIVDFSINLFDVMETTGIAVSNGKNIYEFTGAGGKYVGSVEYPIDSNSYETSVYQYNGDILTAKETIDWIGAGSLMREDALCEFKGLASYGNGRLTVAGTVDYGMNIQENIIAANLIFCDEKTQLNPYLKGSTEINFSKGVETLKEDRIEDTQQLYVEITTESGLIYRLYPSIYAYSDYQVNPDAEVFLGAYQENRLMVILPDETTYEIPLYE
ncbi:MAG: hypothetical protein ACI4TK_16745 [Agathobacter sp.]